MPSPPPDLLTHRLKEVSRSFYLTLRALPRLVRSQIGLAYLLARTTDTIADTAILATDRRLEALRRLRERLQGQSSRPLDLGEFAAHQGTAGERSLIEHVEEALALLDALPATDQERVRNVLGTITSGQELDLLRFAAAAPEHIVALNNDSELEDYTYRVAGCVGEFWTRTCHTHLFPSAPVNERFLLENGVRFGKGLQLINILRDLPADLRQGRCYLPTDRLRQFGLRPGDLLSEATEARLRPLFDDYLARAGDHLRAGWEYIHHIPRSQRRVRLACAWPILIGVRTLSRLKSGRVLSPEARIKIRRSEVWSILLRTILLYPWPGAWRRLWDAESGRESVPHIYRARGG